MLLPLLSQFPMIGTILNLVDAAQQYHNVSARVNSQDAISENLDPMVWEGQADSL